MYDIEKFLKSYKEGITIDVLTEHHENFKYYKHDDLYNFGFVFIVGLWRYYPEDDRVRPYKAVHSSLDEILPIPFNRFDFKDISWANLQWGNGWIDCNVTYNNGNSGNEDMQEFVNERFSYV